MKKVRGWRETLGEATMPRRSRWQLISGVVAFYLVRDLILYVALPAFVLLKAR